MNVEIHRSFEKATLKLPASAQQKIAQLIAQIEAAAAISEISGSPEASVRVCRRDQPLQDFKGLSGQENRKVTKHIFKGAKNNSGFS